jgi:metal iron transporter
MALIISKITVNWGDAFRGFIPSKELFGSGSLYTCVYSLFLRTIAYRRSAVGILGSTVMPHGLFLGSRLATQDRLANDSESDLPKFPETTSSRQMTLSQRMLRSIRSAFSWRRLFSISRSDETSYPPNVLTHADRENNKLGFVRSHMYHGMADVIASLMSFAVIINSL